MIFENNNQFKSYLKKQSNKTGISLPNCYNTFFARALLQRISELSYGQLVVKGSFSHMVHLEKMTRPVTDIDLSSTTLNKNEALLILWKAMYTEDERDIIYDLETQPTTTKNGIIQIKVFAKMGKIKHPVAIDFDPRVKSVLEIQYKRVPYVFDKDEMFYINTPAYEEHFAEKLCIVTESNKPDILNTRVKDFYDIYKLHQGNYDLEKFTYYFGKLLKLKNKIDIENASSKHLTSDFIKKHKNTWENMKKKYEFLDEEPNFEEAVYYTKGIINEQLQKVKTKKIFIN